MSLASLRRRIDRIDSEILDLLGERIRFALKTAELKLTVRDGERERAILSRLQARASGSGRLSPAFIAAVYGLIFEESRRVQEASLSKEVRP